MTKYQIRGIPRPYWGSCTIDYPVPGILNAINLGFLTEMLVLYGRTLLYGKFEFLIVHMQQSAGVLISLVHYRTGRTASVKIW